MGFGQYSKGGGKRYTKEDMLAAISLGDKRGDLASAKKAGHNRLHVKWSDGSQSFHLMQTEIAALSADGSRVTLDNGGFNTVTTRAAIHDALEAFGVEPVRSVWHARDFRRGIFALPSWELIDTTAELSIVAVDSNNAFVSIRYDSETLYIPNEAARWVTPVECLTALLRIDEFCRQAIRHRWNDKALARLQRHVGTIFRYEIGFGDRPRLGKWIDIGCLSFRVADLRSIMRTMAAKYPDAWKEAKALTKASGSLPKAA